MRLVCLEGAFWWFPEDGPTTDTTKAVSGPFSSKPSAKWALLDDLEAGMSESARFLWAQALARAGGSEADVDQLLFVAGLCKREKASAEVVMKFAARPTPTWQPYGRRSDMRSRAAGDA